MAPSKHKSSLLSLVSNGREVSCSQAWKHKTTELAIALTADSAEWQPALICYFNSLAASDWMTLVVPKMGGFSPTKIIDSPPLRSHSTLSWKQGLQRNITFLLKASFSPLSISRGGMISLAALWLHFLCYKWRRGRMNSEIVEWLFFIL